MKRPTVFLDRIAVDEVNASVLDVDMRVHEEARGMVGLERMVKAIRASSQCSTESMSNCTYHIIVEGKTVVLNANGESVSVEAVLHHRISNTNLQSDLRKTNGLAIVTTAAIQV